MPLSRNIIKRGHQYLSLIPTVAHHVLGWALSPPRCTACDKPLKHEAVFCFPCSLSINPLIGPAPLIDGAVSSMAYATYSGALAIGLRRLKYGPCPELAPALAELLFAAMAIPPSYRQPVEHQVLVPVPLHPQRLAERGFNQASLLAQHLNKHLRLPMDTATLCRINPTSTQTQLPSGNRRHNVHDAFAIKKPSNFKDMRVLLVDDVSTTGSTLAACAQAILAVGAQSVSTLVVAQAQRHVPSIEGRLSAV